MPSICVFGDSIAEGYNDSEKGGWVTQLARFLKAPNETLTLYNLSIDTEDTRRIIARFDTELNARKPRTVIFALGTNDSLYFNNDKNNPNVPISEFKNNFKLLITKSKEIGAKVICVGASKVDESKVMPVAWEENIYYDNKNIQIYNESLKKICEELSSTFIETFHLLDYDDLEDGLHPNTKGHTKLFKEVSKYI